MKTLIKKIWHFIRISIVCVMIPFASAIDYCTKKFRDIFMLVIFQFKKREAIQKHKLTGQQHHVVSLVGKLWVVNRDTIKVLNKKLGLNISHFDVLKKAYFSTKNSKRNIG